MGRFLRQQVHSDEVMLEVLHLAEVEGWTGTAIARRMDLTRNVVLAMLNRINAVADKHPDLAVKPENRDGGMRPRWWL